MIHRDHLDRNKEFDIHSNTMIISICGIIFSQRKMVCEKNPSVWDKEEILSGIKSEEHDGER